MSVRLTRHNHHGPRLLETIRNTTEQLPVAEPKSHSPTSTMISTQTDAEIYALPESSDEEETPKKSSDEIEVSNSTKRKREEEDSSMVKRTKSSSKPSRTSQRKLRDVQPDKPPDPSFSIPAADDWLTSQPSQSSQRKNKAGYGKNNSYRPTPRPSQETAGRLVIPDDIPEAETTDSRSLRSKGFVSVQDSPKYTRSNPPKVLKQPPPDINEIPKSSAKFSIPDDSLLLEPSPSTNSLDTDHPRIFDSTYSPEASARTRKGSTSSLSSVDSIASALLSQSQKDSLKNGIDPSTTSIPPGYIQCPLCSDLVLKSTLDVPPPKHASKLSLRAQQSFCQTHKLKDAQRIWSTSSYPTISWSDLESTRIHSLLPHLTKILLRKKPSFYFSNLESQIASAKGNKRKINAYLLDGVMDVAKPAYYGGKGAKIMGHAIATSFGKQLRMALMQDKTIATAGISGFTSAVLLPELCQRLVMEDMGIEDGNEEEARRIMSESTEIGLLLYPDDDHVELDEAN